jgi:alanine racemase
VKAKKTLKIIRIPDSQTYTRRLKTLSGNIHPVEDMYTNNFADEVEKSPLAWAEIDLDAVAHNVRELRRITGRSAVVMAAVKANGYGHGAVRIAQTALRNGAERLGVANVDEAVDLRKNGIDAPILIFGYTPPERIKTLMAYDLTQSVYSLETAVHLSEAAVLLGKKVRIHIKLDTGMGRVGILSMPGHDPVPAQGYGPIVSEIRGILSQKGCTVEGIFTHFATADHWDKTFAEAQFQHFMDVTGQLRAQGLSPLILHAANSAATIDMPHTHLDMVRPGISIYGLYPSFEVSREVVALKPALAVKTRVVHLKKVPAGFPVSYGCTYETPRATTIATIPLGYADGIFRLLSSRGHMLVNGERAPVAGRVCMDMTMLDVGRIPDVAVGDEVVVIGNQKEESIPAEEIAETVGTISYEVMTAIGHRVMRVYVGRR